MVVGHFPAMDSGAAALCCWSVDRWYIHCRGIAEDERRLSMNEEPNKTYTIGDTVELTVKFAENDFDHTGPCMKTFDVDDVFWLVRFSQQNYAVLTFRYKMESYELQRRSLTPGKYGNWARYLHVTGVVGERSSGLLGAGVSEGYALDSTTIHGVYYSSMNGSTIHENANAKLVRDLSVDMDKILELLNKKG
jgi:hypothetical protein